MDYLMHNRQLYERNISSITTNIALKKFKPLEELLTILDSYRGNGLKIVATGGTYGLPHVGHATLFEAAKELGDILIVCMNTTDSIRSLGRRETYFEHERILDIASRENVGNMVLFDEAHPGRLLSYLRPHIFVKGDDCKHKQIPEKEVVESYGGTFLFLERPYSHISSSVVAERIKKNLR